MVPMLKAILFDVDGTLAETEESHRQAFNAAFAQAQMDLQWSVAQYRELLKVTGGKERLRAYFGAAGAAPPDERIRALHAAKNAFYAQAIAAGAVALRPGVLRLMREARAAGMCLGIATTTSAENLDALLQPLLGAAWRQDFASVVAGDQVARKKPAPDVYCACLEELGLPGAAAVAIEDSAAGVRAARAAGVGVVATPSRYTERDDLSQADCVLPNLGDPERPWESVPPGFARPYLQLDDLRRQFAGAGGRRREPVALP